MQAGTPKQLVTHIKNKVPGWDENTHYSGILIYLSTSHSWRVEIDTDYLRTDLDRTFFQQSAFEYVYRCHAQLICVICECKVDRYDACSRCLAIKTQLKSKRLAHHLAAHKCILQRTSQDIVRLVCSWLFTLTTHPDLRPA